MAEPVETAGGAMVATPVALIELRHSDGRCGHSYLRTYSPMALRSLAALLEDLAELVVGHPAEPEGPSRRLPHTPRCAR